MKDFGYEQHFGGAFELKGKSFSIFHSKVKGNDPRGLNRTFVLCYLYFCFCLELSPLVMNRHLTPNLYHLDAILAHSLIQNLTFSTNQGKI